MKKISLILLLAASTVTTFASSEDSRLKEKASIQREISQYIKCPSFVTENSSTNNVKAIVRVNEAGQIELFEIESENEMLKKYVLAELKQINLGSSAPKATGKFVLVIRFLAQ
jgi:hypothetical protein